MSTEGQPTGETYRIETVADMLKVPPERRACMLRELEQTLLLTELAFGEQPPVVAMMWTDDGERHSHIDDEAGKHVLSLRVTNVDEARQQP